MGVRIRVDGCQVVLLKEGKKSFIKSTQISLPDIS